MIMELRAEVSHQSLPLRDCRMPGVDIADCCRSTICVLWSLNRKLDAANKAVIKANHMKSSFIQHITHEIRTPLQFDYRFHP